jgi:hypothetical protein
VLFVGIHQNKRKQTRFFGKIAARNVVFSKGLDEILDTWNGKAPVAEAHRGFVLN